MNSVNTRPVTVIITAYNQATLIGGAVSSCLSQSVPVSVVVVDDGSSDDPESALPDDPNVIYVRQANGGVCKARNRGLSEATGDYVIFLDGDDELFPKAVQNHIKEIGDAHFAVGRARHVSAYMRPLPTPRFPVHNGDLYEQILRCSWIYPSGSMMVRRDVALRIGGFDENLPHGGEDLAFYFALSRGFNGIDHTRPVVKYRVGVGVTQDAAKMLDRIMAVYDAERGHTVTNTRLEAARQEGQERVRWMWKSHLRPSTWPIRVVCAANRPRFFVHSLRQQVRGLLAYPFDLRSRGDK